MIITIPNEKPMSWNKLYSGVHWTKRREEANRVHLIVRSCLNPNCQQFDVPVDIEFRAYFKNKKLQLDSSNICAKLYEDGLIGWVIENDSPEYVRSMKTVSLLDRDNPRVEIEITPVF